jgi:hypothetical protein
MRLKSRRLPDISGWSSKFCSIIGERVAALKSFLRGEPGGSAPTVIILVRDPRDEAVSRLQYTACGYFSTRPTTIEDRAAWIEIFRHKEDAPDSVGSSTWSGG